MIFNNPATEIRFLAREKELSLLHKKVEDFKKGYRQNIAILGKANIGKTSLLMHFISTLDSSDAVPIYIDLKQLSFNGFVNRFIAMLLHNYLGATVNTYDIEQMAEGISSNLPKTYKKIKAVYSHVASGKEKMAFEELLDLPLCFSTESAKFCIIIFDNFTKLSEYNLKEPFSVLGEKIMLQKTSLYVLSGYSGADSKKILSEELSLLFGKFYVMDLDAFNMQEAMAFVDTKSKTFKLPAELKGFLAYFTGGKPFYLDVLTEAMAKKANDNRMSIVSESDFYLVLSDVIFAGHSVLNLYFTRIIENASDAFDPRKAIKILHAIMQKNKLADIISCCGYTREQAVKLIERFMEQDVVIKNGPLHAIDDEIFKLWVNVKYSEMMGSLSLIQKAARRNSKTR